MKKQIPLLLAGSAVITAAAALFFVLTRTTGPPAGDVREAESLPDTSVEHGISTNGTATAEQPIESTLTEDPAALVLELRRSILWNRPRRVRAARAALLTVGDQAVPELINLLNSGNPVLETASFNILMDMGSAAAVGAAIGKALSIPEDARHKADILESFASIREKPVVRLLIDMLGRESDASARGRIMEILSVMRGPAVVETLAASIEDPRNSEEIRNSTAVLATLSHTSNVPALADAIQSSGEPTVWRASAVALANIGNPEACTRLIEFSAYEGLSEYCLTALATVSSPPALTFLLDVLADTEKRPEVRSAAARALGNYPERRAALELTVLLDGEEDIRVREAIAESLDTIISNLDYQP
ncbi:MAG: HEAT repeat domain-containing protein [Kiritimatiellia bacterium]